MSTSEFEKNAEEVLAKCGRHCCICRRFRPTILQVHHIVERESGGGDDINNLMAACLTCHSDAHTKRPFARRFSSDELKLHRDRVYQMVADGTLIPPEDDGIPFSPSAVFQPGRPNSEEPFIITAKDGLIEPRLPKESVEILLAAANSPAGQVVISQGTAGLGINAGGKSLVPENNARTEAFYEYGVKKLVENGFLDGYGDVWHVTRPGYLLADALAAVLSQGRS